MTQSRLQNPRGRIDLARLSREGRISPEIPCRFHPRTEDCLLNQVLMAGLELAGNLTDDRELRMESRRLAQMLSSRFAISALRLNQLVLITAQNQLSRLTAAYAPALQIIELFLLAMGIDPAVANGKSLQTAGFLFDMNRFFQALVGRFLRESLAPLGFGIFGEKTILGMMRYDPHHNPQRRKAPAPRPDYWVRDAAQGVQIFDAKYRDLWNKALPPAMLYQLSVYALSQRSMGGAATILYPCLDTDARDAVIRLQDPRTEMAIGMVVLRPLNLHQLADVVNGKSSTAADRQTLALQLVSQFQGAK